MSSRRVRLGMLTPSSNTVLEPVTHDMLAALGHASAHFSRFEVTEISLDPHGLAQFDDDARLPAAALLGHAKCDVIAWNGTSAAWLGFEHDETLCAAITRHTGAAATTSILANNDLFGRHDVRRFGLVTPYTDDVQTRIIENYAQAGFECVAERHFGIRDNFSFGEVDAQTIEASVREVARARPDGIAIVCTNLRAAPLVPALEAQIGITIYDSIAVVVARSLELAGVDTTPLAPWGAIFDNTRGRA